MNPTRGLASDASGFQSNILSVFNLMACTTYSHLVDLFETFGEIERISAYPSRRVAFVQYPRVEEAVAAKEALQGAILNGSRIKIAFARPAKPSKRLWVTGISPSVSKDQLEGGFRKFGKMKEFWFPRHSDIALIEYFDINDAIQAMSMNEERMGGRYLRVEFLLSLGPIKYPPSFGDVKGDDIPPGGGDDTGKRPEVFVNDPPVRDFRGSMESHVVGNEGSWRRPSPAQSTSLPIRPNHGNEGSCMRPSLAQSTSLPIRPNHGNEGSWMRPSLALSTSLPIRPNHGNEGSWMRPSLALSTSLPIRPSHGSWEGYDPAQLDREPKRTRRDGSVTNTDFMWRGIIAKSGTPVFHARCIPIGKGIESELPEIINCSARTGLDMLASHYNKAIGVEIAFFIPDRDEDLVPYTEFIRYLDSKNRAYVAKLDGGTTLFLAPPSDFLPNVVPGRLYGVVLKLPPPCVPAASSYRQESQPIPQSSIDQSLYDYNRGMQEESLLAPSSESVAVPNSAMPQSGVILTPELLAILTSLLSKTSQPSASESHQSLGLSNEAQSQAWNRDQSTVSDPSNLSFSSQYNPVGQQTHPPPRHYPPVSSTPSYSGGLVQGGMQYQAAFVGMYSQGSHEAVHQPEVPMLNPNYRAVSGAVNPGLHGYDQTHNANISQEQQELQHFFPGADQSTLQYAANVLRQINQQQQLPPNAPTGKGTRD